MNREAYRISRNHLNNIMQKAKKWYYTTQLNKCLDPSKQWETLCQLLRPNAKIKGIESISRGNHSITNSLDIANAVNEFSISIGLKLAKSISTQIPTLLASQAQSLNLIPTTTNDVEKIIFQLKDYAAGKDNI